MSRGVAGLGWILCAAFVACTPAAAPGVADTLADVAGDDVVDVEVLSAPCASLEAGDDAWVRRAVSAILGRRPLGVYEVAALVDLVEQTDRETVALALTHDPAFSALWVAWLSDELGVNRVAKKEHGACFRQGMILGDVAPLTAHLKAHGPAGVPFEVPFNMADVLRASVEGDDLSLAYRAHLFAGHVRPSEYCGNTPVEEMERTRRREFAHKFRARVTGRTLGCLPCHNSSWSVTDDPDPELDRHWPLPGRLEAAVFGADVGLDEPSLAAPFRFSGVVAHASITLEEEREKTAPETVAVMTPWGMDEACGALLPSVDITSDPFGEVPFLADGLEAGATVWDVEAILTDGIAALRTTGRDWAQDDEVDGPRALAYLLASRVADRVWAAVAGTPLTLGHGFPRNASQRDLLSRLTDRVIADDWSLRRLVVAAVTEPALNPVSPDAACDEAAAYGLAPRFAPFSVHAEAPVHRGNSIGDRLVRASGWALLH
ncbi:MAG: hypothetical protein QF464_10560, partial [Myxococcota bacterium]|nr:hypothetical protein [Myxococcota bacterium]